MTINGFELHITNEYGFELDSFLGAIYLPWHTIILTTLAVVAYKAYKKWGNRK
jgi:hypothetical protein